MSGAEHGRPGSPIKLSTAERAEVETYLGRLTQKVRDLAERLETLKIDLGGPASLARPPVRQAVSRDRRSQRGAP